MMILNELSFMAGPFDGWKVLENPSFQTHYYIPIEGDKYHYYLLNGTTYLYQGEVEVAMAD